METKESVHPVETVVVHERESTQVGTMEDESTQEDHIRRLQRRRNCSYFTYQDHFTFHIQMHTCMTIVLMTIIFVFHIYNIPRTFPSFELTGGIDRCKSLRVGNNSFLLSSSPTFFPLAINGSTLDSQPLFGTAEIAPFPFDLWFVGAAILTYFLMLLWTPYAVMLAQTFIVFSVGIAIARIAIGGMANDIPIGFAGCTSDGEEFLVSGHNPSRTAKFEIQLGSLTSFATWRPEADSSIGAHYGLVHGSLCLLFITHMFHSFIYVRQRERLKTW